ncbi:MAG: LytR/AlgR family response regulator transcription factor [Flavipsychrobacter sp.]
MKLNCIIVDDEPIARKILEEYIEDVGFLALAGKAENPIKAGELLANNAVDILFLDINMPRMNGIEFLKTLGAGPATIMTTAYSDYAVEGFELNVLDYLVKPFSYERFLRACNKAKDHLLLQAKNSSTEQMPDHFFVKHNGCIEKVLYSELIYAEAMQNYVVLHTTTKKLIVYVTFKGIAEQLPEEKFLKIHKSTLINIDKIKSIDGNMVNMGSVTAVISQNLYSTVMERIVKDRMIKR